MKKPGAGVILFDLDHTLFDSAWRDDLIEPCKASGDWTRYHDLLGQDKPAADGIALYRLFRAAGFIIYGCTARPERWRNRTMEKLDQTNISFNGLLMRLDEAFLPSPEIKLGLARKQFGENFAQQILFIVDDREDVCAAFAAEGVSALQIHNRNYGWKPQE